jgi:hypothetical protein
LWSPTRKADGSRWVFWELLGRVRKGDLVFHLRGTSGKQAFEGYSVADTDGYVTARRPPAVGAAWAQANEFYRVPLVGFTPLSSPIPLREFFASKELALRALLSQNRTRAADLKERFFYVVQAGRLQCLNGAYLSDFGPELSELLLGAVISDAKPDEPKDSFFVATRMQVAEVRSRIGQCAFSARVRSNYGGACCFPSCEIAEEELLVGAHIARWADAEDLRGAVANGLCLCLFHDRAFELGLFTVAAGRIVVNRQRAASSAWATLALVPYDNGAIRRAAIPPSAEALARHWERVGYRPPGGGTSASTWVSGRRSGEA